MVLRVHVLKKSLDQRKKKYICVFRGKNAAMRGFFYTGGVGGVKTFLCFFVRDFPLIIVDCFPPDQRVLLTLSDHFFQWNMLFISTTRNCH